MSAKANDLNKAVKALKVTAKPKLNLLCMHGYRQNAEQFKSKIGSFRKFLKPFANFEFVDAPHRAKPLQSGAEEVEEQRGWWFNQADGTFNIEQGPAAHGFTDSLRFLEETWQNGSYDGILAFSQGASFLSAVCAMSVKSREFVNTLNHLKAEFEFLETPIKPKFVILVSGFKSVSSEHDSLYNDKIDIPSLHVSGTTDKVIPHEMHLLLEDAFVNPVTFHHEGGHHLPATVDEKPTYRKFIEDQIAIIHPLSNQ